MWKKEEKPNHTIYQLNSVHHTCTQLPCITIGHPRSKKKPLLTFGCQNGGRDNVFSLGEGGIPVISLCLVARIKWPFLDLTQPVPQWCHSRFVKGSKNTTKKNFTEKVRQNENTGLNLKAPTSLLRFPRQNETFFEITFLQSDYSAPRQWLNYRKTNQFSRYRFQTLFSEPCLVLTQGRVFSMSVFAGS